MNTPKETEIPHVPLQQTLSDIHLSYGVDFPVDTCIGPPDTCLNEYTRRANLLPRIRQDSYLLIAREYGPDSEEASAARIVKEIGDDFDAIFLSQLKQKGEEPLPWNGYDKEHADHLVDTIDLLLKDPKLEKYFQLNPESRGILNLIKELTSTASPTILKDIQLNLETLGVSQFKRHKPVILFLLSDWNMDPNREPDDPIRVLEPDCRLIFPYSTDRHQAIEAMVERDIRSLAPFFPESNWTQMPTGIVGTAVMWVGSELASYTIGEAFDGHGFVFTPNIVKSRGSIEDTFARAGITVPENLDSLIFRLFSRHELGHAYDDSPDPFLFEFTTDAPTVALTLTEALGENDETLTAIVALLLGEYQMYANDSINGEATSDGYRISCLIILNKLFEYHLVEVVEDGRIHIHQDRTECTKLIKDLTQLHGRITARDPETLKSLLSIEPSPDVLHFLDSAHSVT